MNIGTWLFTKLKGRQVGSDAAGNLYFEEKRQRPGSLRNRRWVAYAGRGGGQRRAAGVARVAALHHRCAAVGAGRKVWQKPHLANATGTPVQLPAARA